MRHVAAILVISSTCVCRVLEKWRPAYNIKHSQSQLRKYWIGKVIQHNLLEHSVRFELMKQLDLWEICLLECFAAVWAQRAWIAISDFDLSRWLIRASLYQFYTDTRPYQLISLLATFNGAESKGIAYSRSGATLLATGAWTPRRSFSCSFAGKVISLIEFGDASWFSSTLLAVWKCE